MTGQVIAFKDVQVSPRGEVLNIDFFNTRFLAIVAAINALALRQDVFDATENTLVATGLDRVNQVLGPLLIHLQQAASLGFLVADAVGISVSLTVGLDKQFTVTSSGQDLFTPTPFILAQDKTDDTNWGILSTTSYAPTTGIFAGHCLYASKTQASTQWTLSCNSAMLSAMQALLASAQAAATAATTAYDGVAGSISVLNDLIAAVAAGPVASVAGKSGAVVLALADVVGLVDALAAKAPSDSLTSGLNTKQNVSAILSALAGLTLGADKVIYATGAASVSTSTLTSFGRTLLAATNAAGARAALGLGDAAVQSAAAFEPAFTSLPSGEIAGQVTADQVTEHWFTAAENGKVVSFNYGIDTVGHLPADLPVGWNAMAYQKGVGAMYFIADWPSVVHNRRGQFRTGGQFSVVSVVCVGNSDGGHAEFVLGGDTVP